VATALHFSFYGEPKQVVGCVCVCVSVRFPSANRYITCRIDMFAEPISGVSCHDDIATLFCMSTALGPKLQLDCL